MRGKFALTLAVTLPSYAASAYEWKSHNQMAFNARQILLIKVATDPQLRAFLQDNEHHGFGEDLDTRAGNRCDPEEKGCEKTDEDYLEGELLDGDLCSYHERECRPWFSCSFDHFHPKLSWPVARTDALEHARYYFDMAVKLYKAGVCRPKLKDAYHRWAAQALGHAIHLVQEMGSSRRGGSDCEPWPLPCPAEVLAFNANNQCESRNEVSE